jgi:hypothetical protein
VIARGDLARQFESVQRRFARHWRAVRAVLKRPPIGSSASLIRSAWRDLEAGRAFVR